MTKENGSPRWLVLLLVLAGVGVDLATLSWVWQNANMTSPSPGDTLLVAAGAVLSAVLVGLGVAIGVIRTHGR